MTSPIIPVIRVHGARGHSQARISGDTGRGYAKAWRMDGLFSVDVVYAPGKVLVKDGKPVGPEGELALRQAEERLKQYTFGVTK